MTDRKAPGVCAVIPFPRERLSKRRRVSAPPLKRVHIGSELRLFLEQMAARGRP
jgi:hypothetical protein